MELGTDTLYILTITKYFLKKNQFLVFLFGFFFFCKCYLLNVCTKAGLKGFHCDHQKPRSGEESWQYLSLRSVTALHFSLFETGFSFSKERHASPAASAPVLRYCAAMLPAASSFCFTTEEKSSRCPAKKACLWERSDVRQVLAR